MSDFIWLKDMALKKNHRHLGSILQKILSATMIQMRHKLEGLVTTVAGFLGYVLFKH